MGSTMEDRRSQASLASPRESFAGHKSIRMPTGRKRSDSMAFSADLHGKSACTSKKISSFVSDDSDVFNMATLPERIDLSKYGSVAKEIEALILLRKQKQRCDLARHPSLPCKFPTLKKNQDERVLNLSTEQAAHPVHHNSIGMVDIFSADGVSATMPITIVDSDDEDKGNEMMGNLCGEVLLGNPVEQVTAKETMEIEVALEEKEIDTEFMDICMSCGVEVKVTDLKKEGKSGTDSGNCKSNYIWPVKSLLFDPKDTEVKPDEEQTDTGLMNEGVLFGIQGEATELKKEENCKSEHGNDDLGNIFPEMASVGDCSEKTKAASEEEQTNTVSVEEDILSGVEDYSTESDKEGNHRADRENDDQLELWSEMLFAFESSKDVEVRCSSGGQSGLDCDHSFLLRDDIGYVCRICGIVQKKIEKIFDFQYKVRRTGRTYNSQCWDAKDREPSENTANGAKSTEQDLGVGIYAHPRHRKQMKPHQVEGFNFLVSNLLMDNPGGCILAHAPGSGKTFMIISFLQSFLARYPDARPLVVLPKGILGTWRKEFQTWQIQDMPLYDFYSCKAENRAQQLSLLDKWVEKNGILFLGYKQFATIICDAGTTKASAACREMLLNVPKILILDEGHTPRNESTDVLQSLRQVRTARKVVLSGTLYQNHVKEVFNILDLVRPKFLRSDNSRAIVKRVMSKVDLSSCARRQLTSDQVFYDAVEYTLLKDDDISRKTTVVRDLREMTCKVLHYYKGDFLDELPGLVDFTVLLHVTAKQRSEVEKLKKLDQFKRSSVGSAIYVHPRLKHYLDNDSETKDRGSSIDEGKLEKVLEKLDVGDGVKAKFFLHMLGLCESTGEKVLVFSQYLLPLNFLERLTKKYKCWEPGREIFMILGDSSPESREWSMERFNSSPDAKVLFGSIKACGEGISLVGASRILILDVHLNPSVTRQAIGRAHRPGQKKKVYTYRLVAADSPEENDHFTCLKKESISKMWFEWNDCYGHFDLNLRTVDVNASGDTFLRSPLLQEDVKVLYRR